jgi:hypothetical protein
MTPRRVLLRWLALAALAASAPARSADTDGLAGLLAQPACGSTRIAGAMPVLTPGAVDGFLSQGGMVELANFNEVLRLDVNLSALRWLHLGMTSQVLMLAPHVRE